MLSYQERVQPPHPSQPQPRPSTSQTHERVSSLSRMCVRARCRCCSTVDPHTAYSVSSARRMIHEMGEPPSQMPPHDGTRGVCKQGRGRLTAVHGSQIMRTSGLSPSWRRSSRRRRRWQDEPQRSPSARAYRQSDRQHETRRSSGRRCCSRCHHLLRRSCGHADLR